jgi:hypothetical protein
MNLIKINNKKRMLKCNLLIIFKTSMISIKILTILILILLIFKNFKANKKLNSYKFKTL